MITVKRTDSNDADFVKMVKLLDAELAVIDGEDHAFYSQYNKIDMIRHTIVLYNDNEPIGSGAIKRFSDDAMEVKRMYVAPAGRNKGLATRILLELEQWAKELGYSDCVLETGKRQQDAIALYTKNGYTVVENYGQYIGVENSVCFKKRLD